MMSKNTFFTSSQTNVDEIDLLQVTASLLRQKFLICIITTSAIALSCIYAATRKSVWEGSAQIVLESPDNSAGGRIAQIAAANPLLSNLAAIGTESDVNSLATEVKILESPSVLKPTFDFFKSAKSNAGEDISGLKYSSWVGSLSIELVKGTSILNLTYRDTDKTLILPVLNQIIDTYQEYSGLDRQRGLSKGLAYLQEQLEKLQEQSAQSMRAAQAYALNNGLGIQDGLPAQEGGLTSVSSVEGNREILQNKVNTLRQQIAAARSIGGASLYQAPQLQANTQLYSQLQDIEADLKYKSALLTQRDQSVQSLQRQRSSLISYINQQTIGLLQGELLTAEAELASFTRPREVVLRHRELVRTALRDEKLLSDLESQLQAVRLDKARQTDPWELISTPTLLDTPVAPNRKRIVALGLLGGLVMGCGVGLIRDRIIGLVFSEAELKSFLPCPLLERLPAASPQDWSGTAQLLSEGPLASAKSVGLLVLGQVLPEQIEELSTSLRNALGDRNLVVGNEPLVIRHVDTQLVVTAPGVTQRRKLRQLREKLTLQGTPLAGWLLIDPEMGA